IDASLWADREDWPIADRREEGGANPPAFQSFDLAVRGRLRQARNHSRMAVQIDRDRLLEECRADELLIGSRRGTAGGGERGRGRHALQDPATLDGARRRTEPAINACREWLQAAAPHRSILLSTNRLTTSCRSALDDAELRRGRDDPLHAESGGREQP